MSGAPAEATRYFSRSSSRFGDDLASAARLHQAAVRQANELSNFARNSVGRASTSLQRELDAARAALAAQAAATLEAEAEVRALGISAHEFDLKLAKAYAELDAERKSSIAKAEELSCALSELTDKLSEANMECEGQRALAEALALETINFRDERERFAADLQAARAEAKAACESEASALRSLEAVRIELANKELRIEQLAADAGECPNRCLPGRCLPGVLAYVCARHDAEPVRACDVCRLRRAADLLPAVPRAGALTGSRLSLRSVPRTARH
jgi:hypothetical protein